MKHLVTGGAGFIGSNLAAAAMRRGGDVTVVDDLSREGADRNLAWLRTQGAFRWRHADVRVRADVERVVAEAAPDVVFHMAGQVAMTTSTRHPRHDFETNVVGGFNVLETVRERAPDAVVVYSSTNKVYGDLGFVAYDETPTRWVARGYEDGFDEKVPLDFQTPYGCSKGAVDQYARDYFRMFGVRTIVFRHSSVFGTRQFSTFDQGWIGWFVSQILAQRSADAPPFSIAGDGKQVRDVLFVDDLVDCYFAALDAREAVWGEAFNLGGGMANSMSLLELFAFAGERVGVTPRFERLPERKSDQKVFVADTRKITSATGWTPRVSKEEGVRRMIDWVASAG